MTQKCKYPDCHQAATNLWALVPLCPHHFEEITDETERYYNGSYATKISAYDRKIYEKIEAFTPWGKKGKG
jgi:hypothetical protein